MRERISIGAFLLFSALTVLNTCQVQFNKIGNGLTLRVLVPGSFSGGAKGTTGLAASPKSLVGGSSVTVTITEHGTTNSVVQTLYINEKANLDFSFSLSSSGLYDVAAQIDDAGGSPLSQLTTQLKVPAGNYPVVLTMPTTLYDLLLNDGTGSPELSTTFVPTTYSYTAYSSCASPYAMTLTTLDPNATLEVIENPFDPSSILLPAGSPSGSTCSINNPGSLEEIIIVVRAVDGSTLTYTVVIPFSGC